MKRTIIGFIFGLVLALSIPTVADTIFQFTQSQFEIYMNGEKLDTSFYVHEGKNYGSVRDIAEGMGLDIQVEGKKAHITTPLTDLETVAKNCKDSCVMIYAYLPDGKISQGSGWVYNGYVITAKHVIEGATRISVHPNDLSYGISATIVPIETDLDIAVLKTYITKPSVILGDSDKLIEGQKLVSITSPHGMKNSIDECVNSGIAKLQRGTFIMVSESSMDNGSSGGAIFNYKGEIVASLVTGYDDRNYTIPINDIKPILEQLK